MFRIPVYRVALVREGSQAVPRKQICSPRDAHDILRPLLGTVDREHLIAMTLDTKNVVIGINTVSVGDLNSAIASPREVFKMAVIQNAAGLIVAHNHPSGNIEPSQEDLEISRRLEAAGQVLGIELLDHMVLGERGYASLKEYGYFPGSPSQGRFLLANQLAPRRLRLPPNRPIV